MRQCALYCRKSYASRPERRLRCRFPPVSVHCSGATTSCGFLCGPVGGEDGILMWRCSASALPMPPACARGAFDAYGCHCAVCAPAAAFFSPQRSAQRMVKVIQGRRRVAFAQLQHRWRGEAPATGPAYIQIGGQVQRLRADRRKTSSGKPSSALRRVACHFD